MRLNIVVAVAAALSLSSAAAAAPKRPNFLIIVADDLGFSDLGAFGGEIATPNLDALATSGVRFSGFHTAPTCSPTRAMLLSGTDNHRAGLGTMAEMIAPNQRGKAGHEGYLKPNVAALPELLAANGYRTLQSGKWHLGLAPEQNPHARGFQRSFAMLQGAHNHFGQGIEDDPRGVTYTEEGKRLRSLPEDFYSSDYFATKLIQFLAETKQGDRKDQPFFAYLTFTAPHWPLQAPAEDIAKYKGRYDAGLEVLREQRLRRQQELGLVKPGTSAHSPKLPKQGWASLTPEEQQAAARSMEVFAAMVDRVDQNVGRVIAELKRTGELENTIILFLSDNGAEGLDITQAPFVQDRVANADNRLENIGSASSYVSYGPGWASAAAAPSWLFKGYATEGGTRVVSFISGPGLSGGGRVANAFTSVADVVPTFLELAGIPDHQGTFAGRAVEPIRGKSLVPYLTGRSDRVYAAGEPFGTELFGSRSIRQGDWKVTDAGDGQWALFNLAEDPGETTDLAQSEPERLAQLIAAWDAYAKDVGVILPNQVIYRP